MAYLTEISCTGAGKKQYPWSEYVDSAENPDIKFDILLSLTCCKNHTLLQTYLKGSLSEKSLSNEEIPRIITAIAKNGAAFDLVPGFLSANIKTIYNR